MATPQTFGSEFRVNTYTHGNPGFINSSQATPSMTTLSDGSFVVTWRSAGQDGSGSGVYGQHFDADGTPNGDEFQVNTYTNGNQYNASVAALPDGGFEIIWQSDGQNGSGQSVYGQRYNANGTPNGGEFLASGQTTITPTTTSTATLSDGSYVIARQEGFNQHIRIFGQRYHADGTEDGDAFQVSNTGSFGFNSYFPSITALENGSFAITWSTALNPFDSFSSNVYGQIFTANNPATTISATPNAAINGTLTYDAGNAFIPSSGVTALGSNYTIDANGVWNYTLNNGNADVLALEDNAQLSDSFIVTHQDGTEQTVTFTVLGINDPAIISGQFNVIATEDADEILGNQATVTDVDSPDNFQAATGTSTFGSYTLDENGNWTYELDNVNATVTALDVGATLSDSFVIRSSDGTEQIISILINGTNDSPVIEVQENIILDGSTNLVTTISSTDAEGHTITISLGGFDGALFGHDPATGEISFLAAPDYNAPLDNGADAIYNLDIIATDSEGAVTTRPVIITLINGIITNGTSQNNVLTGTAEDDSLNGLGGDDTLIAGAGDDILDGGEGIDTALYQDDTAGITANLSANQANGTGIGTDTLNNIENVTGGSGNDNLTGDSQANNLTGNAGNDTLLGLAGIDYLIGGAGDDTIHGGDDGDIIDGGADNNFLYGEGGDDYILGGTGVDLIEGGTGIDQIYAAGGNDQISGGDGNDYLFGQEGNDTINGDNGDDYIDGGNGLNTLVGGNGNNTIFGGADKDIITGGDDFDRIDGGAGDDEINGGNGANYIWGRDGGDIIQGGIDNDYIDGGDGLNTINAGGGNDTVLGGADKDIIAGGDGIDILLGLAGNDEINGNNDNDYIWAGDGNDIVHGGDGNDAILGQAGNDQLFGGAGIDLIVTGDGINLVEAGEGHDTVWGGNGVDTIDAGTGNDTVQGGAGNDIIDGRAGIDYLAGDGGDDTITGGDGADILWGYADNDTLSGDAGIDQLFGGAGNDIINGGSGNDYLYGEAGNDTFVFEAGWGNDTVLDFTDSDTLDMQAFATNFDQLTLTDLGGSTLVELGNDSILLYGIDFSTVDNDDFQF